MTPRQQTVKSVLERYFPGWNCSFCDSELGTPCIRLANDTWVVYEDEAMLDAPGLYGLAVGIALAIVQVYWKQGRRDFNKLYRLRMNETQRIKALWAMEPV